MLLSTFLFLLFQTWLDYSPAIPFGEHPVLNTYSLHWKHCNNTKKFISVYYWNIGWVFLNFLYQKYIKQYNCHIVKITAFLIIRWGNIKSRGWKTPSNRHLEAVIVRISILLCMQKKRVYAWLHFLLNLQITCQFILLKITIFIYFIAATPLLIWMYLS